MAANKIKILVVDDEESVRILFQRVLQAAGYDAITASNGQEALSFIAEGNIGMVLLDINMPGMSGLDVLSKINAEWPDICVMMVTAIADVQTAVKTMQMGAYDYITKPFSQDKMLGRIRTAIDRWQERLDDRQHYLQLQQNISDQTKRMQEQFTELVESLTREHKLLQQLAAKQSSDGKSSFSELPPELQKPINSVEEFRDAVLRILKRS